MFELALPDADEAILTAVERELLDPDIISDAMEAALAIVAGDPQRSEAHRVSLREQEQQLFSELTNLTQAVAAGQGRFDTLLRRLPSANPV